MPDLRNPSGDLDDDVDLDSDPDDDPGDEPRPDHPGSDHPGGPDGSGGGTDARGGLRGALRGRWALPVVVAVLLVLVTAAGARQARAAATAELDRTRQLAALQLGTLQVAWDGSGVQRDADGRVLVRAEVTVLNGGQRPVGVTAVGTSTASAALTRPARTGQLRPGSSGLLSLQVAVDCRGVAPVASGSRAGPAPGQWLALRVDLDGRTTALRRLTAQTPWSSLEEQLPYLCDPWYSGGASAAATADLDGALVVTIDNSLASTPARITLDAAPELRVTADPALPLEVAPGTQAQVSLAADPDCSAIGPHAAADATTLPVGLDRVITPGQTEEITDRSTTTGWVARRVALACG